MPRFLSSSRRPGHEVMRRSAVVARLEIQGQPRSGQAVAIVNLTLGQLLGETATHRWMMSAFSISGSLSCVEIRSTGIGPRLVPQGSNTYYRSRYTTGFQRAAQPRPADGTKPGLSKASRLLLIPLSATLAR